ncbi:MAG: J domain-containing protein [Chlamydiales bacterium]|nr:J domain-containing protein [Chlamydiales bacterium]
MMCWWRLFIGLVLGFSSCSSSSEEAFCAQGKKIVKEIVLTLKDVENHEELEAVTGQLKKHFKKLARLLAEVRAFRNSHPDIVWQKGILPEAEELFIQLARLYEIPGCREIMERSQRDAVSLLLRSQ